MTAAPLVDTLQRALAAHPDGALCVGLSGGPDSTALLHALAALPQARARGLRAVHVDHGLDPASHAWAERCRAFCGAHDITLQVHPVQVERQAGAGLEAAARAARYAAFAAALQSREYLLTAHHRDDQVETVLLKLLRGAGPEGLGGMRECRPFARGWLWRPLLDTPRAALAAYLDAHGLTGILDPSNRDPRQARNFLRLTILPRLAERWPDAAQAIGHSARLSRDAADYIAAGSDAALAALRQPADGSLDARGWLELHPALRGPVLELWLRAQGMAAPTLAQRDQLERQAETAAADRVPLVRWPGTAVHVWRGRLHAHPPLPEVPRHWKATWNGTLLQLPAGAGTLELVGSQPAARTPPPALEVRLGTDGIRLRPAGDTHTRELRDLFQRAAVPPWRRRRCPLIFAADGTLLAVADLWQTQAAKALFNALGRHPAWQPAC